MARMMPSSENTAADGTTRHLLDGLAAIARWQASFGPYETSSSLIVPDERIGAVLGTLAERLTDNYPFHHPNYAGQMLKPPHPVAAMAYAMAMAINPNNHALDGGPATAALEREVVARLAGMFGYQEHLGHLTSSGTIANLEALYVARALHPGKAIAHSTQAHYTHGRMADVLGIRAIAVDADAQGRMDLAALERVLASGEVGTVVATLGTTGLGALDPLEAIVPLARQYGARVHVDAAYGGFYRLLALHAPPLVAAAPFSATAEADSIVVDPHKHGLQPYGCGCVLFKDPSVGRFYRHDSPYTYFTSPELHLGEISLECSRAGAAAAALWATLECLPLAPDAGLGPVLAACRRAALDWSARLAASPVLALVTAPELDIVAYCPRAATASAVSAASERVFAALMAAEQPIFLAKFRVPVAMLAERLPGLVADAETVTVLRSALLKPEHESWVPTLHARVEAAAR